MLTVAIIVGALLCLLAFVGALLPALPGPPLSLAALVILALVTKFAPPLTITLLVAMTIMTTVVAVVDYVVPVIGAKKFGATRWGIFGSIIGMVAGIWIPPLGLGMLLGAIFGAVVGELMGGKTGRAALKAGFGTLLGTVLAIAIKVAACGIMTYYFIRAAWAQVV